MKLPDFTLLIVKVQALLIDFHQERSILDESII
jgi:hypothetical protein